MKHTDASHGSLFIAGHGRGGWRAQVPASGSEPWLPPAAPSHRKCPKSQLRTRISSGGKSRVPFGGFTSTLSRESAWISATPCLRPPAAVLAAAAAHTCLPAAPLHLDAQDFAEMNASGSQYSPAALRKKWMATSRAAPSSLPRLASRQPSTESRSRTSPSSATSRDCFSPLATFSVRRS